MCEKRKNGVDRMYQRYKFFNKIQRSNDRVAQDKESLEMQNDS